MISSLKDTKEFIEYIKSINLSDYDIENIKTMIDKSLSYPFFIFPQVKGSRIFRGQICSEKPHNKISRLSYNPNPALKIGSANLKQESVFYASGSLDNAAIESCQDELKNGSKVFYVTVGEWILKNNLEINFICHSKMAQSTGTDINDAVESIDPLIRKGKTEEQYQVFMLKSEFFADQFAKSQISSSIDYAFSAIYSSHILQNNEKLCQGICFPSVAYKLKGFNFAYNKDLFDNGFFNFIEAYHVKLTFVNSEVYPIIDMLSVSKCFDNDYIYW